jgi:hypothetical protein
VKRVIGTGLVATFAAMVATTVVAAVAKAVGVDFKVSDGETIPMSGITFMTAVFSVIGIVIAVALRRWSARSAERFVQTAVILTVLSLVAPFLSGGDAATVAALVGLHLVAATVMIPSVARSLRQQTGSRLRRTEQLARQR